MPRFFFDFYQSGQNIPDSEGIELADAEQAYAEAFKAGQEMWSQLLRQRHDPRRCFFRVRSAAGETLFIFPLQEVVDSCAERQTFQLGRVFNELTTTVNYARQVSNEFMREIESMRRSLQDSRALLEEEDTR